MKMENYNNCILLLPATYSSSGVFLFNTLPQVISFSIIKLHLEVKKKQIKFIFNWHFAYKDTPALGGNTVTLDLYRSFQYKGGLGKLPQCLTTRYNVYSVHRGCSLHRGVFSTSGGYHEYIVGIP